MLVPLLHGQHIEHCLDAQHVAQRSSIWEHIPGPATKHLHDLRHNPPQHPDQAWVYAHQPDIVLDPKQPVSRGYVPGGLCLSL